MSTIVRDRRLGMHQMISEWSNEWVIRCRRRVTKGARRLCVPTPRTARQIFFWICIKTAKIERLWPRIWIPRTRFTLNPLSVHAQRIIIEFSNLIGRFHSPSQIHHVRAFLPLSPIQRTSFLPWLRPVNISPYRVHHHRVEFSLNGPQNRIPRLTKPLYYVSLG